jgi:glucan phosphorylase
LSRSITPSAPRTVCLAIGIGRIKENIKTIAPQFSMTRMIKEYINDLYVPVISSAKEPPQA